PSNKRKVGTRDLSCPIGDREVGSIENYTHGIHSPLRGTAPQGREITRAGGRRGVLRPGWSPAGLRAEPGAASVLEGLPVEGAPGAHRRRDQERRPALPSQEPGQRGQDQAIGRARRGRAAWWCSTANWGA